MSTQARRGAIYNYANLLLINVIGLVLTPYIIRSLGPSQYGLYVLITALIPYFALLDLGMGKTVTRFVAYHRARNDAEGEARFLTTASRIYILVVTLMLLLGALTYFNIDRIWGSNFNTAELDDIRAMMIVTIATQAIIIPGNIFTAICNGCGLFAFPRGIQPIKYAVRALCIATLLFVGEKALAIIAVDAILNIVVVALTFCHVKRHIGRKRIFSRQATKSRPILQYSGWIALYAITCTFQWNIAQIIAGTSSDAATVGIMGVGILLGNMFGYFAETINRMTIPHATRFVSKNPTPQEVTTEMSRIGRIVAIPQLGILGGFVVFGQDFVTLWAGDLYHEAYHIALIMMGTWLIQLTQDYGNSLIEAKGRVRIMSIVNFISIFAGVIAAYLVAPRWGVMGLACSLAGGTLLATLSCNIYYRLYLRLNTVEYFKRVFGKSLMVTATLTGLFAIAKEQLIAAQSWLWMMIGIICYIISYIALTYLITLTAEEREELKRHAKRG